MDKPSDAWELENHPYTPEGEIEGLGRFADGINRRKRQGRMRVVALVIVLALVVPAVIGVLTVVVDALR